MVVHNLVLVVVLSCGFVYSLLLVTIILPIFLFDPLNSIVEIVTGLLLLMNP